MYLGNNRAKKAERDLNPLNSFRSRPSTSSAWADLEELGRSYQPREESPSPDPGDPSILFLDADDEPSHTEEPQKSPVSEDDVLEVVFFAVNMINQNQNVSSQIEVVDLSEANENDSTNNIEINCDNDSIQILDPSTPEPNTSTRKRKLGNRSKETKNKEPNRNEQSKKTGEENYQKNITDAMRAWECPICYEGMEGRTIVSTVCGHVFCKPCMANNLSTLKKCPTCRAPINKRKVHDLFLFTASK